MVREDPKSLMRELKKAKAKAIKVTGASGTTFLMSPQRKYYIDVKLAHMRQNDDFLQVKVGEERSGKSVLGDQDGDYIASQTKTPFNINNIHFNYRHYMKASQNSRKLTYHRHDEARHDMNKFRRLSTSNVIFNNYLSECGEDNIAHDIILPRYSDLDPGVGIDRNKMITKVYKFPDPSNPLKLVRGLYSIWSTKDKDLLAEASKSNSNKFNGKMFMCFGYFDDTEIIPKEDYDKKKKENRKKKYEQIEAGGNVHMHQRNILLYILNKDVDLIDMISNKVKKNNKVKNLSTREISTMLKKYEVDLKHVAIGQAIRSTTSDK